MNVFDWIRWFLHRLIFAVPPGKRGILDFCYAYFFLRPGSEARVTFARGLLLLSALTARRSFEPFLFLLLDHARHVGQQLLGVIDDAVLDRPLDAADSLSLAGLFIELERAGSVQDLEIFERVLVNDHQVGQQPWPHYAEFDRLALRLAQCKRRVHGR